METVKIDIYSNIDNHYNNDNIEVLKIASYYNIISSKVYCPAFEQFRHVSQKLERNMMSLSEDNVDILVYKYCRTWTFDCPSHDYDHSQQLINNN